MCNMCFTDVKSVQVNGWIIHVVDVTKNFFTDYYVLLLTTVKFNAKLCHKQDMEMDISGQHLRFMSVLQRRHEISCLRTLSHVEYVFR